MTPRIFCEHDKERTTVAHGAEPDVALLMAESAEHILKNAKVHASDIDVVITPMASAPPILW